MLICFGQNFLRYHQFKIFSAVGPRYSLCLNSRQELKFKSPPSLREQTLKDSLNTMMQGTENENAAGLRRICKRSDQPKLVGTDDQSINWLLHYLLHRADETQQGRSFLRSISLAPLFSKLWRNCYEKNYDSEQQKDLLLQLFSSKLRRLSVYLG